MVSSKPNRTNIAGRYPNKATCTKTRKNKGIFSAGYCSCITRKMLHRAIPWYRRVRRWEALLKPATREKLHAFEERM
jgi:hypothetical protein